MAIQKDVLVGNRYKARVNGRHVIVRVTGIEKPDNARWGRKDKTKFVLFNETTKRPTRDRTAAFLRKQISCVLRGNLCLKCTSPTYSELKTCKACFEAYKAKQESKDLVERLLAIGANTPVGITGPYSL